MQNKFVKMNGICKIKLWIIFILKPKFEQDISVVYVLTQISRLSPRCSGQSFNGKAYVTQTHLTTIIKLFLWQFNYFVICPWAVIWHDIISSEEALINA